MSCRCRLPSVIVRATLDMAGIILTAAGLGFLGLGAQPPHAGMGRHDLRRAARYMLDQWWVAAVPGVAIFIVSLGFNLLGDGLRDVLGSEDDQMASRISLCCEVENLSVTLSSAPTGVVDAVQQASASSSAARSSASSARSGSGKSTLGPRHH